MPGVSRSFAARTSGRRGTSIGFLLAAMVFAVQGAGVSSHAFAWDDAPDGGADPAATRTVELLVVDANKKPVPRASVEIRAKPAPKAEQIQRGKFIKSHRYGADVETDDAGSLVVVVPKNPKNFTFKIATAGYAPYWASWSNERNVEVVPDKFTAELDPGWSTGGTVVDEEGQPIAGAEIHPSVRFKMRPGDDQELHFGSSLKSDAQGNWRFDYVPQSQNEVHVNFNHPNYMPLRASLARSQFELAAGAAPDAKMVLSRGLVVTGRVIDPDGKPIEGALVRAKFRNEQRKATSNAEGKYQLAGCEPGVVRVVVSAKSRATDLAEVQVAPEMKPVDFQMQPGGTIRVRVLDEQDRPVPKARIFLQSWRGRSDYFEFDHVNTYADANGVWEWHEAPLDKFYADVCRPEGMQLSWRALMARGEEYVFRVPPALQISGKVIDAETRQPVAKFRVTPGLRFAGGPVQWTRREAFDAREGTYELRRQYEYSAYLVRVEAPGYVPATSREIKSDEGAIDVDFELQRGKDVVATVLTPDDKPAAGAKVALGAEGDQISVINGDVDSGQTYAARTASDDAGKFRFPSPSGAYQIVITHPTGFAHFDSAKEELPESIQLTAWARVEGVYRVGPNFIAGAPLTLNASALNSFDRGTARIFTQYNATTGAGGKYVFERVLPGEGSIGRRMLLMVNEGASEVTSATMQRATFTAGETTHLDLGGSGRAVVGKLQPPVAFQGEVPWRFALIHVEIDVPRPMLPPVPDEIRNDPVRLQLWQQQWRGVFDAYQNAVNAAPRISASVAPDGAFRIDDVPAGKYVLSVRFFERPAGRVVRHPFVVEEVKEEASADAVNLGAIRLQP